MFELQNFCSEKQTIPSFQLSFIDYYYYIQILDVCIADSLNEFIDANLQFPQGCFECARPKTQAAEIAASIQLWIEKALEHGGDKSAVIVDHYGDILFKLDLKEDAMKSWIKAKELGLESDFIDKKIRDKKIYE